MDSRTATRGLTWLVKASFEQVAKNPDLRNKWITTGAWLQLVQESNLGGEMLKKINQRDFTRTIKKEYLVGEDNSINCYGVYFRNKRLRGGRRAKAQSRNITCFLVTDPGTLPPAPETQ